MSATLGSTLRAHRLGWRYVAQLDGYLRVRDGKDDQFVVDLAAPGCIPSDRQAARCWWECDPPTRAELIAAVQTAVAGNLPRPRTKGLRSIMFTTDGVVCAGVTAL